MIRNISVGIDIGSKTTRVVMGEFLKGEKNPKIVGVGESETKGMRHGYIVNSLSLVNSLKSALRMAEETSGIKIRRAFIALGGTTLRGEMSGGTCVISKADGEVTSLDVNKVLQDCEDNLNLNNKKVVQVSPVNFRLDGKEVLGRLEGMYGMKLEAKAIFVTYSVQHLEDLLEVIAEAGVKAIDIIASPIAISHIVLSEKQKIVGVALVAIGDQTTSLSVFENGLLISIKTFSIGSSDITNDIALGLKIPLEQAERFKKGEIEETHHHKKLKEIIEARLSDIFELVENHLKKIKRSELLPAGIVFVGGGANTKGLEELSKSVLKLPATIGTTELFSNSKTKLRDSSWFTALGLVIYGKNDNSYSDNSFINLFKDIKNIVKSSVKQLIP
ncbi:cell division protein FtsA [Candidatus Nomurabacteria bacterium RIFCSPLOWO2_01_FULL_39_18]|uniref:Cell division protein FtsA n=1 Tax=Candidatus Nomurabacteria bacterium RIFCSPHIGHO2_01_FULL_40_24b TaxID=1801739 RepID=A0A1F6V855_9BACT|nr:MAG: cell division protein FtsA [Candidatus Nomurabacteria bacterium RIFCSPHIGHO2_01_FULL_40_24b]OGI89809.1 MAG: cell division protein FtsA [Candidatus Nomurabacteria bacterium RIFCSPLOWO2_01_FULL_39_18]